MSSMLVFDNKKHGDLRAAAVLMFARVDCSTSIKESTHAC